MAGSSAVLGSGVDFSRSPVSRYLQLAMLFRRRIETGEWVVDRQIPTVDHLATECGVARATVRQALGVLEDEGLIERFRAKGTFVRNRPGRNLWCEVETDWSGLLRAQDGATIEVLSPPSLRLPADFPHPIGIPAGRYRHLRRRHWRDGAPYLLADVYYEESVFQRIPQHDWTAKTALRIIVDLPALVIGKAQQTLTIGTADIERAGLLHVPLNAPVALVRRSAADAEGRIVMVADGTYRGDVVRLDIKLK